MTPLDLEWRIAGIPCRERLTNYERGTDGPCIEYDMLDSRGRTGLPEKKFCVTVPVAHV